jgi:hypothetical protein
MRFNQNAQLDPSQVEDRRSGGLSRGGGLGSPIVIGGGGGGLLLVVLYVAMQLLGGPSITTTDTQAPQPVEVAGSTLESTCRTGADANSRTDCRMVGIVNSVQQYWSTELPRHGVRYSEADTVLYSGVTRAGCGVADAAAGPFYCPVDLRVYLDLTFFDELTSRFGARGGPFAQAYVVAHEYGHHVQNLIGVLNQQGAGARGPQGSGVRIELQADCLAGIWGKHALETGYISDLTDADIADGLDAAAAVGDDRIQRQTQGSVTPESWTHGSAAQRQQWFRTGYQSGDLNACDTSRGSV